MTSGQHFKVLRKQKKIKLIALGRIVGLSPASISRYENNVSAPSINTVDTLFDALGYRLIPVPKEYLIQ